MKTLLVDLMKMAKELSKYKETYRITKNIIIKLWKEEKDEHTGNNNAP